MGIGLTEEHEALAASVRGLAERHITAQVVRQAVAAEEARRTADDPAPATRERPPFWSMLTAQGLPGLHLPEEFGGQGYGLVEQAVVLEELGRALAPGPYLPTVLAGAAIDLYASDEARAELLPGLADGSRTAAVALTGRLDGAEHPEGTRVTGEVGPVLGAPHADLLLIPAGSGWVVVQAADVRVETLDGLDLTRPVGTVRVDGAVVPGRHRFTGDVRRLAGVLLGAEACGIAGWALDTAVGYAGLRQQFGRPIGQFQGVKHRCARMLIALEEARATVWDGARAQTAPPEEGRGERAYAGLAAALRAPEAAVTCAEDVIQVHGGIGYTFEHDAHLYYRRALSLRALGRWPAELRAEAGELAVAKVRRPMTIELPPESAALRERIAGEVAELRDLEPVEQRAAMAAGGWVTPHLPRPWGRDAGPLEQVVIQQELKEAQVRPVPLMIAAWVVPSLVQYGTPGQQERFLPPTLRGEIIWCQLFSEPGAGSDLASLTTKAEKVEGGWKITGQKIWTSLAREAQWGICLARSEPDAPKHEGITYFLVDMKSAGLDIRPLRECTGDAIFNEVFLDGVFVPDELVVGPVNRGWRVARNTLANERVGLTSSFQLGGDLAGLVELGTGLRLAEDPVFLDRLGRLAVADQAFQLLGLRATLKQLSGTDPGATANVRKLVAMELGQRITEYGVEILGEEGALVGGPRSPEDRRWTRYLLASRAMTIGGGTTEVNLNVIGERILGLPRDPDPTR